jgi:methylenetetrahydrofolate dehydrogenase (NADP+)/methenyltetrahydrofolate cyclohydrolase
MAHLLLEQNATVTITHSRTKNLAELTKQADIVVVAIGRPNYLTGEMIKDGAIVIDVGINRLEKKLVGDVDFENVAEKAGYLTPVPGGVGPMTIIMLMVNTIKACRLRRTP